MIAKPLIDFVAQTFIFGYVGFRLWAWRVSPKGRAVLAGYRAAVAFWLLVLLLLAFFVASVWLNLLPGLGVQP